MEDIIEKALNDAFVAGRSKQSFADFKKEWEENQPEPEIKKKDVVTAIAEILIRLAKRDFDGVRRQLWYSSELFEKWVISRPEKKLNSEQNPETSVATGDYSSNLAGKTKK